MLNCSSKTKIPSSPISAILSKRYPISWFSGSLFLAQGREDVFLCLSFTEAPSQSCVVKDYWNLTRPPNGNQMDPLTDGSDGFDEISCNLGACSLLIRGFH